MKIGFLGLLTLVFIVLKLTHYIDWSWVWVLSPLWLGYFKTEVESFKAYKTAKEAFIKEQANKWKSQIDERAYNALMNYTVEITD